jgi:hypothetical protein
LAGDFLNSLLYRNHFIIYGASLDGWTGHYAPTGQVAWHTAEGKQLKHCFTLSRLCARAADAKAAALEEAIIWTDERIAVGEYR